MTTLVGSPSGSSFLLAAAELRRRAWELSNQAGEAEGVARQAEAEANEARSRAETLRKKASECLAVAELLAPEPEARAA